MAEGVVANPVDGSIQASGRISGAEIAAPSASDYKVGKQTLQDLLDERPAQEQSDWTESDVSKKSYIKNKPIVEDRFLELQGKNEQTVDGNVHINGVLEVGSIDVPEPQFVTKAEFNEKIGEINGKIGTIGDVLDDVNGEG